MDSLTYACVDGNWELDEAALRKLEELFPSVNVRVECGNALKWMAHKERRMLRAGMLGYLSRWLSHCLQNAARQTQG